MARSADGGWAAVVVCDNCSSGGGASGSKSNNGGAPGSNNLGTLPSVATAAAPTYGEGNQVSLSTDLAGALRVSGSSGGGVAQTQVRSSGNAWTDVGYSAGDLNVPVQQGPAHDGGYEWGMDLARVGGAAIAEGQAAMAASVPVVIASNQSNVGVSVNNTPTVTANAGTNLNTSALALDATLTGGSTKAIARGGAKGTTTAADVTSTAEGSNNNALDVQLYSGGVAKDPTAIRALTSADTVSVTDGSGPLTVDGTVTVTQGTAAASTAGWPSTAGTVAAATAAWTSATTVDTAAQLTVTGYSVVALSFNPSGSITAGSLNFEVSDDSGTTWYAATATRQDSATSETTFALNAATKKLWQIGVGGLATVRVRLNPVITGAGTANIRLQASNAAPETQVTVAQAAAANLNATVTGTVTTSPPANATENVAQFGGTNVSTGAGAGGAGIPRVTISNDSSLAANQSVNAAQFGGANVSTGAGAGGAGIPRVTVSNDSSLLGTKTNNNAAPGATNFGVLPAIANAAAPSWTEGNLVGLSTDLAGTARTDMTKVAGSATATAATGVQLVGIEGRAGTSFETTAGVLDYNLKNVGNSAASTAASGVLKVGVVGNAGAAFDGATGAVPPANAILTGLRESTNQVAAVQCDKSFNTSVTAAATTSLVAVSGTTGIYLCSYVIEIIGVATTAGSAQLEFGTGSACATTQQVITPAYLGTLDGTNKSATVIAQGPGTGYLAKSGASGVLCLVAAADANSIKVFGTYAQF